jgi:nucleoside-diphosphate-sugar epimerase
MKILFVGGTGLISSACAALAAQRGHELTLVNRASARAYAPPAGVRVIVADVRGDEAGLASQLESARFDAVVDWVAYTKTDVERDLRLFRDRTDQYVFISSASAYQKPPSRYLITEDTPLANPYWAYSRDKIACEERLVREHNERGFPVVIVRPSLTYGPTQIPLCVGSWNHPYTVIDRMKRGAKVIVPGDGSSLWTLTWNEDFAVGLVGLLGRSEAIGRAFHVTSDEVLTWNQIYREAGAAAGVEPNIVHVPSDLIGLYDPGALGSLTGDKANSCVFDNSRIRSLVPEFSPRVTWAEGVRRALAWFEADPARQTIDGEANTLWDTIVRAYERALPSGTRSS